MVNASSAHAGIDFQGKHAEEQFQFYFRQHWVRLTWPFVKMLGSSVLIIAVGYMLFITIGVDDAIARRFLLLLLAFLFIMFQMEFLIRFYRYFLYVIVVTDKKVHRIKKTFLAFDDHQSIDLWVLQDIYKSQRGIVQISLGYGTLSIEAQYTTLRLHFVPNISEKYRVLLSLREQARMQVSHLEPGPPAGEKKTIEE